MFFQVQKPPARGLELGAFLAVLGFFGLLRLASGLDLVPAGTALAASVVDQDQDTKLRGSPDRRVADSRSASHRSVKEARTFHDLDAYLRYLQGLGATDGAWYREVAPGVYELVTMMPPNPGEKRLYTRAELMAKFGFDR